MTINNSKIIILAALFTFGIMATGPARITHADELPQMDSKLEACLKDKIGSDAYGSIKDGSRTATADETAKSKACFEQFGRPVDKIKNETKNPDKPKFSDSTAACLKTTLGSDYEKQFANVSSPEAGQKLRDKASGCFDKESKERQGGEGAKQCVIKTVGETEANKMFGGERPSADSATFKKLEAAGCLKKFDRPKGADGDQNLSAENKQCIEGIMGKVGSEPTEEQKKQVGAKCFGGSKPGGDSGSGRPALPSGVEACLGQKLGASFKTKESGAMSDDEKNKAGECFKQNNFTPEGATAPQGGNRPAMSDASKACIEQVTGKPASSPPADEETKKKIGEQCFGGGQKGVQGESRGSDNRPPAGVEDSGANRPSDTPPEATRTYGANPTCEKNIIGTAVEVTDAMRQQINSECYAGRNSGGSQGAPQTTEQHGIQPGETSNDSEANRTRPGGCQDDACVQQYCAANPSACSGKSQ